VKPGTENPRTGTHGTEPTPEATVTDATGHLPYWTLEQLAEGDLSHRERTVAEQHLRSCSHCTAELESARALIAALEGLPAFSPSEAFAQSVMARVQIVPLTSEAAAPAAAAEARTRWLPATVKGWMGLMTALVAFIAPLAMLGVYLAAHPLVSVGALWGVGRAWVTNVAWNAIVEATGAVARSGAVNGLADLLAGVPGPTTAGVPTLLLLILAAIPVSALLMVRLLKTPATGMTHAY
jgi:anti-sigma factor RsiW